MEQTMGYPIYGNPYVRGGYCRPVFSGSSALNIRHENRVHIWKTRLEKVSGIRRRGYQDMEISQNGGTQQWMVYSGKSY